MKRSPLIILFITVVIDLLGFGIILPLLPLYVKQFGGTPVQAGLLTASFSVMQFIFSPIWGRMSDLYGRRPLILFSLLGSCLTFLLFGAANSLWVLFAARIMGGIATSASLPTAQAYIADVTPPEKRSRGMALIGVAFGIGFACGPWIGGALGAIDLRYPAFAVAAISGLNFVWSFFALPESHITDRDEAHARKVKLLETGRLRQAFSNPTLGELLTVFSVATFSFALMEATFTWLVLLRFVEPQYGAHLAGSALESRAASMVGPIFGIVGITAVFSQGAVMGGLAERVGERKLIWIGSVVLTGALVGIGVTRNLALLTVLAACLAFGSGMMNPALSSLISKVAGHNERGALMGVQQSLGSFARIIAPPLGTWLLAYSIGIPFGTPYFVAGALMAVAFVLSLYLKEPPATEPGAPLDVAIH